MALNALGYYKFIYCNLCCKKIIKTTTNRFVFYNVKTAAKGTTSIDYDAHVVQQFAANYDNRQPCKIRMIFNKSTTYVFFFEFADDDADNPNKPPWVMN